MSKKARRISKQPEFREPFVAVLNRLIEEERCADLLALYCFYYLKAVRQQTDTVRASTSETGEAMGWSEAKVRTTKKKLHELNMVSDTQTRSPDNRHIAAHRVRLTINPFNFSTPRDSQPQEPPSNVSNIERDIDIERRGVPGEERGTKQPSKKKTETKRFRKPTPKEVEEYATSIGFELDGEYFCDHYQAKGWKISNSPMKDWKAAVRTWKKNAQRWGTTDTARAIVKVDPAVKHLAEILQDVYLALTKLKSITPEQFNRLCDSAKQVQAYFEKLPGKASEPDIDAVFDEKGRVNPSCRHSVKYLYKSPKHLAVSFTKYLEENCSGYSRLGVGNVCFDSQMWKRFIGQEEEKFGLDFKTGRALRRH